MKIFSAQLKGTTTVVSGSTASITGSFTGSIAGIDINATNQFTASTIARLNSIETISSSSDSRINSLESFTSSTSARLNSIETISASNISRLNSIETISASNIARLTSLESTSASVDTLNITQNTRLASLEIKTGSLATTGSNTFIGTQTITGSLYITTDLIVQGSSSLQNITASAVSIGTNIVNLNTANPAVRYAGLSIGDSGSLGGSGSFLYDSVQDEMIFVHRGANTTVTSSVVLMGPQTYDNIGTEIYPTSNYIQKGAGNEHLTDSCIIDNGTTVCVNANLKGNSHACFSNSVCSCASSTLYSYFDGNNTVLPNPTDRPHIFRTSSGGLGLSANNEGAVSQPISMFTCGAQRFTILPNGNVGINTNNPLSQLDVNVLAGGARRLFVNYADSLVTIKSANDTSTAETLRVWGDNIIFNVTSVGSGVEAMRITNTCRVGIGTNTPCAVLHISNAAPYIYLTDTSTNGARPTARIISGDVGTCQSLTFGFACNDGTTCGLDTLVLNEKGNVGIGTNSPGANLEICSPTQNSGNLRFYNGYNSGAHCYGIEFYRNYDAGSNELGGFIKYNRVGGSSGDLIFAIGERGAVSNKLRIEYTGVSCFASDVCVGGNLVVNGATIGVNCNTTTNSDARINFYTRSTATGDRVALYGYNLCAPTSNGEMTYQALGFCTAVNQGYINFQTKNTSGWCNTMIIIGGRVGIGNSSPLGKLHVTTSGITAGAPSLGWPVYNAELDSNARTIYFDTDGNGGVSTAGHGASLVLSLGSYYDSRVIITPPGNGGGSPGDQGTGRGKDLMLKAGTSDNGANYKGGRLYLNGGIGYTSSYGGQVGDVLIQTIGSDGKVGINTSSPSYTLDVNGITRATRYYASTNYFGFFPNYGNTVTWEIGSDASYPGMYFYNGSGGYAFRMTVAGSATFAGGVTSDIRTKQCIKSIDNNATDFIKELKPVSYEFIGDCIKKTRRGFIAQDVLETSIPDLVLGNGEEEGGTYGLDYDGILSLAVKAIQEQQCTIDTLKSCLGIN